jgi:hypothetical protein
VIDPAPPRRALGALAGLLVACAALAAPALAADPALEALRERDAYVPTAAIGESAAVAQAQLRDAAAELAADGRPVKLAIVPGPAGAPSMLAYARRLARELDDDVTLVITAPGGPVVATGPLAPATITRRFRAARVGRIAHPVDRVLAAAALAAPPAPDEGNGVREVLTLIGLAVLGGAWASAWGFRRQSRHARERLVERRAAMGVCLDALRARATAFARRSELPGPARARTQAALAAYADAIAALREARRAEDVDALLPRLRTGLGEIAAAAEAVGERLPADDPFAGLCGVDPAHGPATELAATADRPDAIPVCASCRAAADDGRPAARRLVPAGGRPVPFSEIDPGLRRRDA